MRNIYKVEHKENIQSNQQKEVSNNKIEFLEIKEFFKFMKNHNKTDLQIKSIILAKVKSGDKRFIYNKNSKEILIYKSDFLDII